MKKFFLGAIFFSFLNVGPSTASEILRSLKPIFDLYRSNEIAAWDRYNGNVFQVVGNVGLIDPDNTQIVVKTGEKTLKCYYTPRDHLNIVDLKINGPIAVKGPLQLSKNGRELDLKINNCRVLGRHEYRTKEDIFNYKKYKRSEIEKLNEEKRIQNIMNSEYY